MLTILGFWDPKEWFWRSHSLMCVLLWTIKSLGIKGDGRRRDRKSSYSWQPGFSDGGKLMGCCKELPHLHNAEEGRRWKAVKKEQSKRSWLIKKTTSKQYLCHVEEVLNGGTKEMGEGTSGKFILVESSHTPIVRTEWEVQKNFIPLTKKSKSLGTLKSIFRSIGMIICQLISFFFNRKCVMAGYSILHTFFLNASHISTTFA